MAQTNRRGWQIRRVVDIAGIVAATGLAAAPAFAQDVSQADVAVGYVNIGGTMKGVNVQATFPLTEHWNLVGEFNRASGADCSGCDPEFRDTSMLAGVQVAIPDQSKWEGISIFPRVVVGGVIRLGRAR